MQRLTRSTFHHFGYVAVFLAVAVFLSACDNTMTSPEQTAPPNETSQVTELDALFEKASEEFEVPVSLLKAISYAETGFNMVKGIEEFEGRAPAYGLMALRGERLKKGAELAGVSTEAAQTEPLANIRAAAALLKLEADGLGIQGVNQPERWAKAVAEFSGIENKEAQAGFVHDYVYEALNEGIVAKRDGKVVATIMPMNVTANFPKAEVTAGKSMSTDYGPAIWRGPSPNQNARPSGSIGDPHMVVIHTCQGSYSGCWSWLNNDDANVSAHYVISRYGSEITQLVREYRRAWHIGADYDCNRLDGHDCWRNGYNSNHFTIGIEHAGFVSDPYPAGQVDASAKLGCDISESWNIPRDRNHYWGHDEMQPWNRSDPGPNWPWATYMNSVREYCGDGSGNARIIMDSNDNNSGSNADVAPPESWNVGSYGDYYGTGYYWHVDESTSDPVEFRFYLETAERKTVYAWWTDGSNRNPEAPYVAYNSNGTKLGVIYEDQRFNGGQWNGVGTWDFTAGWNTIAVSHWTGGEGVIIADAVMVE